MHLEISLHVYIIMLQVAIILLLYILHEGCVGEESYVVMERLYSFPY